jgi:DNA mismatch repair protein MutS
MQADKTTLTDLSIFNIEESYSIFNYINFTRTANGKEWLRHFLSHPFNNIKAITETQQTIKKILAVKTAWENTLVSNGTIMVIEKLLMKYPLAPMRSTVFITVFLAPPIFRWCVIR